jgi:hypothetical protein
VTGGVLWRCPRHGVVELDPLSDGSMHPIRGTSRVCLMACERVPLGLGALPWRTGRTVGRTVYDAGDRLIGTLDTPVLAAQAVDAVNGEQRADAEALLERILLAAELPVVEIRAVELPAALRDEIRKHLGK